MKPALHPLQLVLGLAVWAVWFVAAYAGVSIGCIADQRGSGVSPGLLRGLLLASAALVLTGLAFGAVRCMRAGRHAQGAGRFVAAAGACLHLAAALSVAFVALPLGWLPVCP